MALVCKEKWTPDTFYGKCNRFVTQLGFGCCPQKDISFLEDIASIYSSKTVYIDDLKLYDVKQYIEEHHSYTNQFVNLSINDKKGGYLLKMVQKYKPSRSDSFKSVIIGSIDHFDYFEESLPIICVLDNKPNISVKLRKYVTFMGRHSSFDFDSISLFFTPRGHENYYKNMRFMTGTTRISFEMPLVTNYGQIDMLQQIMDFLFESGMYLGMKYASDSTGSTDFKFSFRSRLIGKSTIISAITNNNYTAIANGIESIQNISSGASYVISSKIIIEGVDMILCHLSVLNRDDVVQEAPLKVVQRPRAILQESIIDVLTQYDTTGNDHLAESPDNIIIYNMNMPYFSSIDQLSNALSSEIVYECLVPNYQLRQDPSNVVSDVELFILKRLGTTNGLVLASSMRMVLRMATRPNSSRVFALTTELRRVESTISKYIHENPNANVVSGTHCQPVNGDSVFGIEIVQLV